VTKVTSPAAIDSIDILLYNRFVMEETLDRQFAALADPTRRAILGRLAHGEATVRELAEPFGISQPAISRHLKVLEAAGLVSSSTAAQSRPRRLEPQALAEAVRWLDGLGSLWAESFDRLDALLGEQQREQDR
jgi:DNA-binding transcriptional ArsR family regulator